MKSQWGLFFSRLKNPNSLHISSEERCFVLIVSAALFCDLVVYSVLSDGKCIEVEQCGAQMLEMVVEEPKETSPSPVVRDLAVGRRGWGGAHCEPLRGPGLCPLPHSYWFLPPK